MWPMVPYYGIGCNEHHVNEYKEVHKISVYVFNTSVFSTIELSRERHLVWSWYPWAVASVITQAKPQVCLVVDLIASCISAAEICA